MDATQGVNNEPSAQTTGFDGGELDTSAGVASPQVDTSAVPSDAMQGGEQGVIEPVQAAPEDVQRQIQSAVDRERAKWLAEKYALEQQLKQIQELQLAQLRQQQPAVERNPYDPQTEPDKWWKYEMESYGRRIVEESEKRWEQRIQNAIQQTQEMNWINQHQAEMARQGITVDHIKAYNRMNGIPEWNLDVGWKLMNLPSVVANVARQTQQQTINSIRQPQGANPVKNTMPASNISGKYSYEKLAREFEETQGRCYNSWSKEIQDAFDEETRFRRHNML